MKRILGAVLALFMLLAFTADAASSHEIALQQAEACAFSAEYGGSVGYIRKWVSDVNVYIEGNYNYSDAGFFYSFIKQLSDNVPGMPVINLVNTADEANVRVYFVRLSEMGQVLTSYTEGNWGYFTFWNNGYGEIYTAEIAIAWDVCDSDARRHLLMEEFTGALGIANDHYIDSNSILYQNWTTTQNLTAADWNMLRMVYDPRVTPGMQKDKALRIMESIY